MKPFRERNPVIIGMVGFGLIGTFMVGAFKADELPLIGGGDTYYANFSEIGALRPGNEVRVAGVPVGTVDGFELDGDQVRVAFKMDDGVGFGPDSGAAIKVRTLLGAMYLAVEPDGEGQMETGATIPAERTLPPYDVVSAFSDLSTTTDQIDVEQVREALDTFSDLGQDTPEDFQGALEGLSAVSANLADRDAEINTLLVSLKKVTGVLNSRDQELETLFKDADVLFRAVTARRDEISNLLDATVTLSNELRGLVADNREQLKPTLDQLQEVVTVLKQNEAQLSETLRVFAPFTRVFSNALGNGPWFDNYLSGVEDVAVAEGVEP